MQYAYFVPDQKPHIVHISSLNLGPVYRDCDNLQRMSGEIRGFGGTFYSRIMGSISPTGIINGNSLEYESTSMVNSTRSNLLKLKMKICTSRHARAPAAIAGR